MMKKISFSFALLFSLSANAALTDPQAQTLAAHIRANADPAVVAALAQRNDVALADYYNTGGTCVVWRTAVPPVEYREAIIWTAVDGLTIGTSGTDIILDSLSITAGQTVTINSATLTHAA